jgi:hypothetical protein
MTFVDTLPRIVVTPHHPTSALGRLSRALTGATPVPPTSPTADPVPPSPARSSDAGEHAPVNGPPPVAPQTPKIKPRVKHPHTANNLTATLPNQQTKTQSARAWAQELGLSPATLRYRQRHGWSDMEVLGLRERPRDRAAEQAASAASISNVLIVEDVLVDGVTVRRLVPRPEAARRLNIKHNSVVHKLRDYRAPDGSQVEVELKVLMERRGR